MDYLRQITDLINTAKDTADMLTQQAGEIEVKDALFAEMAKRAGDRAAEIELLTNGTVPALVAEIEVLTTERDNALLRVEELEGEVQEWRTNYGSGYIE